MNKQKIEQIKKDLNDLKKSSKKSLKWYHENADHILGFEYLEFTRFYDEDGKDELEFIGYKPSHCGCCSDEEYSFYLDVKILYDEEYRNSLIKTMKEKLQEQEQKQKEKKELEKKERKQRELRTLAILKEKYKKEEI